MLALLILACDASGSGTPASSDQLRAQADNLEAQAENLEAQASAMDAEATRVADATRSAQDAAARGTADGLAAQATAQALDAQATAQAWAFQATVTAESIRATARSEDATATATRAAATAAAQAIVDSARATEVRATAQHVARQDERERSTQALSTFGPWILLLAGVAALALVVSQALPVLLSRARVIRRQADEGEPIVMLERGQNGSERIALPLRAFWHLIDAAQVPELPEPDLQDRTAARQQLANVVAAQSLGGGRRRTARRLNAPSQPRPQVAPPTIQVVEPQQVEGWLEDVEVQLLTETSNV
jgi:hypothetical protein